jgi:alpha-L-rhamnosidase
MEKYMDWLASQKEGGWHYPGGGVTYGDWLAYEKCNNRHVSVAYYANDAMLMSKMAQILSDSDNDEYAQKATQYHRLYENIKDEFNLRYWNLQPKEKKQANYVLPLAFDLVDGEKKDLAKVLLQKAIRTNNGLLSTGFLGTSLYLPTLSRCDLTNEAYSLLLQRGNPSWLYSIDQGATTIWERWDSYTVDKGFGPADMNSFNHYAYGAVGEWMYRYMAGIDTDEAGPGFRHILLKPELDMRRKLPEGQERIWEVSASYLSNQGLIVSAWKMNEEGVTTYNCSVPANSHATLYLPVSAYGNDIYEGNVKAEDAEGVEYMGMADGRRVYHLTSGNYYFFGTMPDKSILHYEASQKPVIIDRVNGLIRVESEFVESISIYDLKGRLLMYSIGKDTMNISELRHGIYLVYALSDEGRSTVKFIK